MHATTNFFFSISGTTAVLTFIVIVITTFLIVSQIRYFCSPGPWGLPIFGFYPFIRNDFYVHLAELIPKYGDIYLFSMGGNPLVHIGSHRVLRELFIKNADIFPGRSSNNVVLYDLFRDGPIFLNGHPWRIWRKFSSQSLREIGINPNELKGPMLDAIEATLRIFDESKGKPFDLIEVVSFQCSEVVRRLLLGDEVSTKVALKLNKLYAKANILMAEPEMLLSGFFARYLIMPFVKKYKIFADAKHEMDTVLRNIINQHRLDFDPNNPRDIIDLYLREKKIAEDKNDRNAVHLNDKAFIATLMQFYGDGGQVMGSFITCYLKDLSLRLDVQNAIYEEIVREIGTERTPVYDDRDKLPYTNAVLREIERTSTFFPMVPTLTSNRDITVDNVFIPKGTISIVNQYAIHNDASVYKNPKQFDPMRFMPANDTKIQPAEAPITFGIGKRACSGEILVRMELFVFVVSIMQNFTIHVENTENTKMAGKGADFNDIYEIKFKAIPRKTSANGGLFK